MNTKLMTIKGNYRIDCEEKRPDPKSKTPPTGAYLLLHGYRQTGAYIMDKLESAFPENAVLIAPNGPYPIPKKISEEGRYELGFSWYFYDDFKDEFYIDMDLACSILREVIIQNEFLEEFPDLPLTIVGYSQGGFLAPKLATKLNGEKKIKQVIGISCFLKERNLAESLPQRIDQIHGEKDSVLGHETAKEYFKLLKKRGVRGEFHTVPHEGHPLSGQFVRKLSNLLDS